MAWDRTKKDGSAAGLSTNPTVASITKIGERGDPGRGPAIGSAQPSASRRDGDSIDATTPAFPPSRDTIRRQTTDGF